MNAGQLIDYVIAFLKDNQPEGFKMPDRVVLLHYLSEGQRRFAADSGLFMITEKIKSDSEGRAKLKYPAQRIISVKLEDGKREIEWNSDETLEAVYTEFKNKNVLVRYAAVPKDFESEDDECRLPAHYQKAAAWWVISTLNPNPTSLMLYRNLVADARSSVNNYDSRRPVLNFF